VTIKRLKKGIAITCVKIIQGMTNKEIKIK